MAKRNSDYRTRDPEPSFRDPVLTPSPSDPPPPRNDDRPAVAIEVIPPTCKRCGGGKFHRNCATRPSLSADKMTRRKQCVACGQWHVMQSEATKEERARFWPK